MRLSIKGFSHDLRNSPPDCFSPSLRSGRSFESRHEEKSGDRRCGHRIFGRSVGIRTRGLLDPNQARYQTSPHPDRPNYYNEIFPLCQVEHGNFCTEHFCQSETIEFYEVMALGYRVVYSGKEAVSRGEKSTVRLRTMIACMLLLFSLTVRFIWPDGTEQLRKYLLPGVQTVTEQAFLQLCEDLRGGETTMDAVELFCSKIIYGTDEN